MTKKRSNPHQIRWTAEEDAAIRSAAETGGRAEIVRAVNAVSEVINRRGQFVIANRYTKKEVKNVEIVIDNEFDMPEDVLYFGTWRFRENVWRKIGNHYFMR